MSLMEKGTVDRWAIGVAGALADVTELVFPQPCAVCGRGNRALCPVCRAFFVRLTAAPGNVADSLPRWPSEVPCIAAGGYGHEVARAILAFKTGYRMDVSADLSRALGRSVDFLVERYVRERESGHLATTGEAARPVHLVPAPSRAAAFRKRGFVPGEVLARKVARRRRAGPWGRDLPMLKVEASVRLREPLMDRITGSRRLSSSGQKGLTAGRRFDRIHGAMYVARSLSDFRRTGGPSLAGKRCILIDDVATTGSTLGEMKRAIEDAGGHVLAAAVVASVRAPSEKLHENLQ